MTIAEIITQVAAETGVTVQDMKSPRRWASIVAARKVAARRLRASGRSYPEIGRALGNRHPTTAMYLCGALDEYRDRRVIREVAAMFVVECQVEGSA